MVTSQVKKSTNVRPTKAPRWMRRALRFGERVAPDVTARFAERVFLSPRRLRRPIPEEAVLLSGTRSSVRYQGMALPVWSWGEGPTVLLVHGWEGRGSQLARAYVEPLTERGYRVVAFDMPGHGDAPSSPMSVIDFAEVIQRVARALGPIHAIVAHSVAGAAAVMAQARTHLADRLVIIAAPLHPRDFFRGYVDALELSPAMERRVLARLTARYGISLVDVDTRHSAPLIEVPVLVVHDESDPAVPYNHGTALAAALPRASLLSTQGLAHQRVLRAEPVIARVIAHLGPARRRSLAEVIDMELFTPALRGVA